MYFKVIEDNYYNELFKKLKVFVSGFQFDETDEPHLVMFEFAQYMIKKINDESQLIACCRFVDDAVQNGGHKTEDIFALQVFQPLYERTSYVEICRKYLGKESLLLFDKYYDAYLKDYDQPK